MGIIIIRVGSSRLEATVSRVCASTSMIYSTTKVALNLHGICAVLLLGAVGGAGGAEGPRGLRRM